jgi:hypothetical protein
MLDSSLYQTDVLFLQESNFPPKLRAFMQVLEEHLINI